MLVLYVAGFADPAEAIEAVKRHGQLMDDGDEGREPTPLADATVEKLGVKPGDVWML